MGQRRLLPRDLKKYMQRCKDVVMGAHSDVHAPWLAGLKHAIWMCQNVKHDERT